MDGPALSLPLFARLLGARYPHLDLPVRALHEAQGTRRWQGRVQVETGRGWLAWWMARATRLPPAGEGPVDVAIVPDARGEHWTRHIGGHAMPSRLWDERGLLCEQLGLVRFRFRLAESAGGIDWRTAGVSVLGLPLPARWFAGVWAREASDGTRYTFDVQAMLPLLGLLLRYRGWLDVQ